MAPQDRTRPRTEPDAALLASLNESDRHALKLLLEGLAENWSLDGLTILLYQLLIEAQTGPRLPTLLLALGIDRVRALLTPRE